MRLIDADELLTAFPVDDEPTLTKSCVRMTIKNMPTIEPEQRWIPCSERLPEESGQYIITVKYVHVDGYEDLYAEHGEWDGDRWDMFCFGHCGEVEGIIAWMPLPKPCQEVTP